jgi:signal transduction histidine kinase
MDQPTRESLRHLRFSITELINKVRLEIHELRSASDLISETEGADFNYELLRVLSEILRNVSEHSQASLLSIQITDNGIGGAHSKEGSFGLLGIQERITQLNGDIRINSNQLGTTINIELPLEG